MQFEMLPILDKMYALYQKPRNIDRFSKDYLTLLQGDTKGDLAMPISGWNPMAKEHILGKITALKELDAEKIVQHILNEQNIIWKDSFPYITWKVCLCIADDLKGGWTNHYTSDYDSKFKLNALVNRHFCVPFFWSSETYDIPLIQQRTLAYLYRSIYWLSKPKPKTLAQHLEQEEFVANYLKISTHNPDLAAFYQKYKNSEEYNIIFNFFYGDKASEELGFKKYGVKVDRQYFKLF